MPRSITVTRPDAPEARELITELEAELASLYPPDNRHGYSVEKLIAKNVTFFVMRDEGIPVACGGVELAGKEYAELKRMYVRPSFRGRGFGRALLAHLSTFAQVQGVKRLRLETGVHQKDAIKMYESAGFHEIPPFGPYASSEKSKCFERPLA